MTLNIESIQKICSLNLKNVGGLDTIHIMEISNFANGAPVDPAEVYEIKFRRYSGRYRESDGDGRHGQYTDQTLNFYLPRKRAAIETMRRNLRGRRVLIQIVDRNGDNHLMTSALLSFQYNTGAALNDSNGYNCEARGTRILSNFEPQSLSIIQNGSEGAGGGSDFGGGTTPNPGGGGSGNTDIYVKIHPTVLTVVPASSGNAVSLRNKFVRVNDGSRYFIDINGDSLKIEPAMEKQTIAGSGAAAYTLAPPISHELALPNPSNAIADPDRMIVDRNGVILRYNSSMGANAFNEYNLLNDEILLPASMPLALDETITVHYI